jgi:DNA-binding LacI/PurR family transcriptional regulator
MAVPLATIHLDMDRLGKEAARILFEKIERGSKGLKGMERQAVRIAPTLVRRASLGTSHISK